MCPQCVDRRWRNSVGAHRAEKHLRRTLTWHREVDFGPGPALLLAELGFLAEQRGDASEALSLHYQGLSVARDSGDPRSLALAHEGLAGAYALAGQPAQAARFLGTATGPVSQPALHSRRPSAAMSNASPPRPSRRWAQTCSLLSSLPALMRRPT
ncbi:hypothetical protein GCM10009837_67110 [Streptomyces durmitorensis]